MPMSGKKIRVGLLIQNTTVPAWILLMLKKITESGFAEIVLVAAPAAPLSFKKEKPLASLPLNILLKLEKKVVKQQPAWAAENCSSLLANATSIDISFTKNNDGSLDADENSINKIKAAQPDVLLNIGLPILNGNILKTAKHGVWAYDPMLHFDAASMLQKILISKCTAAVRLKMFTGENPSGKILYQSFSANNIVLTKTVNWVYWKAASFVPRLLKHLYEHDNLNLQQQSSTVNDEQREPSPPSSFFFSHLSKLFKTVTQSVFNMEQWVLMHTAHNGNEIPADIKNYAEITPPKDRFWADPCAITHNNRNYIFIEELIFKKKKAHISVMEVDATGKATTPQLVLQKPYHLSYPFIFKDGDEIFMMPETSGNSTIELYQCKNFPNEWEHKINLMENIHAVDATIHFYNNKYWLFVNLRENKGASDWDELFIFYADSLLTQNWQPHKNNPVISDVRTSRPAGKIFSAQGKLYRPSQDCSCAYGYAININEIIELSETAFEEKRITAIRPWQKNIIATHTFFNTGNFCVIDVKKKRRK